MSDVDLLQNNDEAAAQAEEQASQADRDGLRNAMAADILTDTASKPHSRQMVPISQISTISNMRTGTPEVVSLALSIREHGLINPLSVQPSEDEDKPFRLIAGARRLAAVKSLDPSGETLVPVEVFEGLDEAEVLDLQFAENTYVAPEPIEFARAVRLLLNARPSWSASQVARRHGLKPSWVQSHLRLLDLPESVLTKVSNGDLTFTVADMLRKGIKNEEITEEEAAALAEQVASGEANTADVRDATGITLKGGKVLGEGYVPPAPEGYDEWANEDSRKRFEATLGEKNQTSNDVFDDGEDEEWEAWEEEDGGEGTGARKAPSSGPSRREEYSDHQNTVNAARVAAGNEEISTEVLQQYLTGKVLAASSDERLHVLGLERDGIWAHVAGMSEGETLGLLHHLALAMLVEDNDLPGELLAK